MILDWRVTSPSPVPAAGEGKTKAGGGREMIDEKELSPEPEEVLEEYLQYLKEGGKPKCVCRLPYKAFEIGELTQELPEKRAQRIEDLWAEIIELIYDAPDIPGHFNDAGGVCCPHYGNSCGHDHWWEQE